MSDLLILGSPEDSRTDNVTRIASAFSTVGWRTVIARHSSLFALGSTLLCRDDGGNCHKVESFALIWVIGFGSRHTFLDRMQLLNSLDQSKFVNTVHAYLHLHNKAAFLSTSIGSFLPDSVVSDDVSVLLDVLANGGDFVAKPTAGSFGRDVVELEQQTPNARQILTNLATQGYVLLQKKVPTDNEQRWYFARNSVLGVYRKDNVGFRGNVAFDMQPMLYEPTSIEVEFANNIAKLLARQGIQACAVDIAHPYVLDVNFVNPGWFQSMEKLTGKDFSLTLPTLFEAH